jgi:hypothetical protein
MVLAGLGLQASHWAASLFGVLAAHRRLLLFHSKKKKKRRECSSGFGRHVKRQKLGVALLYNGSGHFLRIWGHGERVRERTMRGISFCLLPPPGGGGGGCCGDGHHGWRSGAPEGLSAVWQGEGMPLEEGGVGVGEAF